MSKVILRSGAIIPEIVERGRIGPRNDPNIEKLVLLTKNWYFNLKFIEFSEQKKYSKYLWNMTAIHQKHVKSKIKRKL